MAQNDTLLVFCTFPQAEMAGRIGRKLVEEKLAACVSVLPGVESVYRWQGQVETSAEVLAIIKTTRGKYSQLEQRLRALHPYEVPEIVALQPQDGLPAYLSWIADSV